MFSYCNVIMLFRRVRQRLLFSSSFLLFSSLSARVVFHIPDWLHHLLMTGRILFKNTLEAYTDHYLEYKLNQVVQEHRLVSLITLLRGNSVEG